MPKPFRRFELLLPIRFNDGSDVPDELLERTVQEIRDQFGGTGMHNSAGQWVHQGKLYRDQNVRVYVDVPDTPENRQFFLHFKERLKERFQQIDIWVTTYPLEIV